MSKKVKDVLEAFDEATKNIEEVNAKKVKEESKKVEESKEEPSVEIKSVEELIVKPVKSSEIKGFTTSVKITRNLGNFCNVSIEESVEVAVYDELKYEELRNTAYKQVKKSVIEKISEYKKQG